MKCKIKGYEDIEFEVGQRWITEDGNKMTVTHIENDRFDKWPIKCNDTRSYMVDGIYSSDKTKSDWDLVSLVKFSNSDELVDELADEPEEPVEHRFEPVKELGDKPVDGPAETYKDNEDLWEYHECSRLKVEDTMLAPIGIAEPSVEDKMVDILHQLLAQRDRDLEKISLVFNTFIEMEKMK